MPVEPRERVGLYKVSSRDLLDVYGDARTNDKDDRTVCRIKRSGGLFRNIGDGVCRIDGRVFVKK